MKKLNTLDKLYLIPIIGLLIAIIWIIIDINYVEHRMNRKVLFYGGMLCHLLGSEIIMILVSIKFM